MRRKKSTLSTLFPAVIVAALVVLLALEITNRYDLNFSSALKQKVPAFEAPDLWKANAYLTPQDFKGKVVLLNVWASWCPSCRSEHDTLLTIQHKNIVPIYSLVYKDEASDAKAFLSEHGNPYVKSGLDTQGTIGKYLHVYGTPETFLIDKHGLIRYRHVGVVDERIWQEILLPLVDQYKMEK
ncbi:MAG: DsbE family thiol:disulfide interchange protein [Pseudomonadota bacterium]